MIYIDPPYNTGNEFIYPDNYAESLETYLIYAGLVDNEGKKFSTNTPNEGRFHTKWLNMMYPRLYLARNLLRDDGVIFISIDDCEVNNLRYVLNEIFGEDNFIANILWQKRYVSNATAKHISDMHDHILLYARNADSVTLGLVERSEDQKKDYKNPDNDPRGSWRAQDLSASKPYQAGIFEITGPTGRKFNPPPGRFWRCSRETYDSWLQDNRIWFGKDKTARPMLKAFLTESQEGLRPNTWWSHEFAGHNKEATLETKSLFDGEAPFDTPKPKKLIKRMLELISDKDALALDFFAGSGIMAQAVIEANKEDSGNRRYILVQLPEPTGRNDYATISAICKERIRRVYKKLNSSQGGQLSLYEKGNQHHGFRAFKLDKSNFKIWDGSNPSASEEEIAKQLTMHVDHVLKSSTQEDILYELLLKAGFTLTEKVEKIQMAGKVVFSIADGALLICLENKITRGK